MPKGFLVHLPSRVESLGGNLVKLPVWLDSVGARIKNKWN